MDALATAQANNVTNQNDAQSIRCRVFIGNLNTTQMTKNELETIYSKYGFISGVSMHRGFAFVQFTNELSARLAAAGEDQKLYYNMRVDVNIASEPKDRRRRANNNGGAMLNNGPNMKRQRTDGIPILGSQNNIGLANSVLTNLTGGGGGARLSNLVPLVTPVAPNTGSQPMSGGGAMNNNMLNVAGGNIVNHGVVQAGNSSIKLNSSLAASGGGVHGISLSQAAASLARKPVTGREVKDYLICGICKSAFDQVEKMLLHKQEGCRLRYQCRCHQADAPAVLQCTYCLAEMSSAWELIQHCAAEHDLTIYNQQQTQSATNNDDGNNNNDDNADNRGDDDSTSHVNNDDANNITMKAESMTDELSHANKEDEEQKEEDAAGVNSEFDEGGDQSAAEHAVDIESPTGDEANVSSSNIVVLTGSNEAESGATKSSVTPSARRRSSRRLRRDHDDEEEEEEDDD